MTLLVAEGLCKSYGGRTLLGRRPAVDAVRSVSFSVESGETVALVGESGAGKSTVARLLLRLIEPDGGTAFFDGVDLFGLGRRELRSTRRQLQMIFQDPYGSLDPRLTIEDSIADPLQIHTSASRSERYARSTSLMEQVGLNPALGRRHPAELSGGQLQRASIARALALDPRLIVCDEPVAALDVSVQAQVLNLMRDLQEERGIAYLFITHDLGLVRAIADRVVVMRHGEVVEAATVDDLFNQPQDPYTQELLGAVPSVLPRSRRQTGCERGDRPSDCREDVRCDHSNPVGIPRDGKASLL